MMLAPNALLVMDSSDGQFAVLHKYIELRHDGVYGGFFEQQIVKLYEPIDKLPARVYTYSVFAGILCPMEWEKKLMYLKDAYSAMGAVLREIMDEALENNELKVVNRKSMVNTLYKALVGG